MSAKTAIRALALAGAAALTLGASLIGSAAPAEAQPWGWGHRRGGPPAYFHGGPRWRPSPVYRPFPVYRPYRAWGGPHCVTRARWVDGPWGPRRVLVRRCW